MTEKILHIGLPRLPDPAIFRNPDRTIITAAGDALLSFDPATTCAFIYNMERDRWSIQSKIDFETFLFMCTASGYVVADSEDARRWIAANSTRAQPCELN